MLRPYCDSAPPPLSTCQSEAPSSPMPILSHSQRLANSRAARHNESTIEDPPPRQSPAKKESNYQQINRRVVSGLYIDSLRNESPKKSLIEKLQRSPRQQPLSPGLRPALDRAQSLSSAELPLRDQLSPQSFPKNVPLPARPTRRAPPSPAYATGSSENMSQRSPRTPNRSEMGEMYPRPAGGGGSRGPQYYRDLLLTTHSVSSSRRYKSDTTTESYLFSPPPAPAPDDAKMLSPQKRTAPFRANSTRGVYGS